MTSPEIPAELLTCLEGRSRPLDLLVEVMTAGVWSPVDDILHELEERDVAHLSAQDFGMGVIAAALLLARRGVLNIGEAFDEFPQQYWEGWGGLKHLPNPTQEQMNKAAFVFSKAMDSGKLDGVIHESTAHFVLEALKK